METTFITIHNLSPDANILFASESIVEILGYQPEEVVGSSCFDYFHPEDVPFARRVRDRGVHLDKAAVLHYAAIRGRDGQWVPCECVFTVVYQVLVACTSIYREDARQERRKAEAPAVRRLFSATPRDPRYHMLEHLSAKFRAPNPPPQAQVPLEPRAALIINRFTRNLDIMYATDAVSTVLGLTPEELQDKSFYECIQENCLPEALRCLESAKANDSIAYLRFWYKDPRQPEEHDQQMREASQSSDSDDGGVSLHGRDYQERMDMDTDGTGDSGDSQQGGRLSPTKIGRQRGQIFFSRTSSGESTDYERNSAGAIFDRHHIPSSSPSSVAHSNPGISGMEPATPGPRSEPFEVEAVVSCTSDGLVVIVRKARALVPQPAGLFAAPWGVNAIRPHVYLPDPAVPFRHGLNITHPPPAGPPMEDFMASIQEVAVFAWSLAGINGNMAGYSHGVPRGEAQPPGGLPIYDPYRSFGEPTPGYQPPENQAASIWSEYGGTQEPLEETKSPYQHLRQERLVKLQRQHGSGIVGTSDRAVMAHHHHPLNPPIGLNYQSSAQQHAHMNEQRLQGQNEYPAHFPGNEYNAPAPDASGRRNGGSTNHYGYYERYL